MSDQKKTKAQLIKELGELRRRVSELEQQGTGQAEDVLPAHEERYRIVADYTYDWEYWCTPDGKIVYTSPSCERITGYRAQEFMENPSLLEEIVHPDDHFLLRQHKSLVLQDESEHRVHETDFRILRKNGEVRWIGHTCQIIRRAGGTSLGLRATNRDITESKQAETALRDSERQYRRLFEAAKDGILILDANTGQIVDVNPFLVELLGYSFEEFQGKKLWEVGLFKNIATSKAAFVKLRKKGYSRYEDMPLETKGGKQIEVEFVSNVYQVDHAPVIQCNIRDITERKQAEKRIHKLSRIYAVLSDVNQAIVRVREMQTLYEQICRIAVEKGGFRMAWLGLLDWQTREIRPVAHAGVTGGYLEKLHIVLDDNRRGYGPTAGALHTREHIVANDIEHDPSMVPWREDALPLGYRASAAFPLIVSGEARGALNLYAPEPDFFDDEELKLLDEMTMDISFAMEYAELETQRKRAEREIESLARFPAENPNPILRVGQDGRISYANVAGQILLKHWDCAVGSHLPPAWHDVVDKAVETQSRPTLDVEYRDRICSIMIAPIPQAGYINLYGQDITERKRAEEALHQSEALFRSLVESMPQNVFTKDLEGHFTFANQRYCDTEGKSTEDILGKTDFDLHPPKLASKYRDDDRRVMETRQILDVVEEHQPLGRDKFYVQAIKAPLYDGKGNVAGILGAFWDITAHRLAEETLHLQSAALESAANAIAITNREGIIEWTNSAFTALTGYTAEESHGHNPGELLRSGSHDVPFYRKLWDTILAGQVWRGEIINRRKDGTLYTEEQTITPVLDTQGQVTHFVAVQQDITERKRAEEALKQRAIQLLLLNDISRRVASVMDLDDLLDTTASLIHESFGYEHVGIFMTDKQQEGDLVMKAKAGLYASHFSSDHCLKLGQGMVGWVALYGRRLLANDVSTEMRFHDLFGDGSIKAELSVPIYSEQGNVGVIDVQSRQMNAFSENNVMVIETLADVLATAIHNARLYQELESYSTVLEQAVRDRTEELSRTKDHIEAILNSVGEAIIVFGTDYRIHQVNPAFERLIGYSAAEVELHRYDDPQVVMGLSDDIFRQVSEPHGEHDWHGEMQVRRWDDTLFDAAVSISPVFDTQNKVVAFVGAMRDISLRKEVERLKDAFVSNVSHELRTPITCLKLLHHLLEVNPPKQSSYLEQMGRVIDRLNVLIEDLLRLSRLDQGRVEMNVAPVNLNALVTQYVTDLTLLAESKQLALVVENSLDSITAQADGGLLGQVLSVLLTNALNYTPAGGSVVVSTLTSEQEGQLWVGFSVSDTGPGISAEEQQLLFQRFFRGSVGQASGAPGTGLGLAIAREIVVRHSGRLEVESKGIPGEGAVFTVWLPVKNKTTDELEEE